MRSATHCLAVVSLLCPQLAFAAEAEAVASAAPAATPTGWIASLSAGSPFLSLSAGGGASTGTLGLSASSAVFLERLIDDPAHPLGLLEFFQHPDTVTLAPSFSDSWSPSGHAYQATMSAAGVWYPSRSTGLTAGFSGTTSWHDPSSGTGTYAHGTASVGVRRYLTPWLRADAGVSLTLGHDAMGGLGLQLEAVLADERVLLSASASAYTGLEVSASASASYFFSRRISAGLGLYVSYGAARPLLPNVTFAQVQPRISATVYLTHAVALGVGYGFNINRSATAPTFTTQVSSGASAVVSCRF